MASLAEKFKAILKADGFWAAMRWNNDGVPYRFTAIFVFDGDMLRNICLVDKQNTDITHCPNQPIADSYCIYMTKRRKPFKAHALDNAQLAPPTVRRSQASLAAMSHSEALSRPTIGD